MANIKISAVDLEINNDILKTYKDYLEQSALGASNPQQLEEIFSRVYGARRIAGSPPLVPDYEVPAEGLIKGLVSNFFAKDADGLLRIEAKFSSREATSNTSTTIGGRVTGAVLPEIRSKRGFKTFAEGQEDNIYNYMNKTLKIGGGTDLFNFLKKQAPIFHNAAYNKAKNLTIFSLKSSTSVRAYQIYFPKASFNSQNFGVSYSSEATSNTITFSYFLRNAFERALKNSFNTEITKASLDNFSTLEYANYRSARRTVKVRGAKQQSVTIYWAHTNSIPVANIITRIPKNKNLYKPVQGPSLVDITVAVRGRTKLRMRRGLGEPNPPKIFERSGTFRSSIEAIANMRTNSIEYFYTPYYQSLERYGYEINELVEGSIRSIAQAQFNRRFNLTRRNT
jgi:hypothetical protein